MLTPLLRARPLRPGLRRAGLAVAAALVTAAVLLGHELGRAEPTGNYRPDLPPPALSTGCFPLPAGAELDLAHQVRRDGDVPTDAGPRRRLTGHYDLVDRDEALALLVGGFTEVGFTPTGGDADGAWVRRSLELDDVQVEVSVRSFDGIDDDTLVRGEFVLDLPVVRPASPDPVCSDPATTKRFVPWEPRL